MNTKICPICKTPIPANAPGGFCPACVLRDAEEPAPGGRAAPSLAEVAAAFPQLEVLALIGQGGMGFVYKVRQPSLDRTVALKILSPELSRDPAFAERFAVPLMGPDGEIREWVGVHTDITEGRNAEHPLRESEARFRDGVEPRANAGWHGDVWRSSRFYQRLGARHASDFCDGRLRAREHRGEHRTFTNAERTNLHCGATRAARLGVGPGIAIVFCGIGSLLIYLIRSENPARAADRLRERKGQEELASGQINSRSVPFLEWAQGKWLLDRDESERATASLCGKGQDNSPGTAALLNDLKSYIGTRRVQFLPEALEYHIEVNPDLPPPPNRPGFGETYSSPLPKATKGDSTDRLAVTLQNKGKRSPSSVPIEVPSVFSKTKSGLLMWATSSSNGIQMVTVFRREKKKAPALD